MQRSYTEEQILIVSHRTCTLESVAFKCSWEGQSEISEKLKMIESNLSVKVLVQALKRIDKKLKMTISGFKS